MSYEEVRLDRLVVTTRYSWADIDRVAELISSIPQVTHVDVIEAKFSSRAEAHEPETLRCTLGLAGPDVHTNPQAHAAAIVASALFSGIRGADRIIFESRSDGEAGYDWAIHRGAVLHGPMRDLKILHAIDMGSK